MHFHVLALTAQHCLDYLPFQAFPGASRHYCYVVSIGKSGFDSAQFPACAAVVVAAAGLWQFHSGARYSAFFLPELIVGSGLWGLQELVTLDLQQNHYR